MASKSKKRRQKEQEEREQLLADDAFLEHGSEGVAWFEKHGKKVLIGAGVVLVLVFLGQTMMSSAERSKAERTSALNGAVQAYSEATDLRTTLTSTAAADDRLQPAVDKLKKVRADYPGSAAAQIAAAYEGDLLRRLGKNKEAIEAFKAYKPQTQGTDPLMFMVLEGQGYAAEAAGDREAAMAAYKRLEGQGFYKDFALKHQARLLEAQGDKAGAAKLYTEIIGMEPASPLKQFAEARLKVVE